MATPEKGKAISRRRKKEEERQKEEFEKRSGEVEREREIKARDGETALGAKH